VVAGVIISGLLQAGKFESVQVCKWQVGGLGAVQAERSRERARSTMRVAHRQLYTSSSAINLSLPITSLPSEFRQPVRPTTE